MHSTEATSVTRHDPTDLTNVTRADGGETSIHRAATTVAAQGSNTDPSHREALSGGTPSSVTNIGNNEPAHRPTPSHEVTRNDGDDASPRTAPSPIPQPPAATPNKLVEHTSHNVGGVIPRHTILKVAHPAMMVKVLLELVLASLEQIRSQTRIR